MILPSHQGNMIIGGEQELNPETINRAVEKPFVFPFESYQTVATGRTGIKLVLTTIRERENQSVLLPSYLCPSILLPCEECQAKITYFAINEDLTVDLEDLGDKVRRMRPDVILFIDYFGFPISHSARCVLNAFKEKCTVIEDCVQGSLIEFEEPEIGGTGHFAITSFRKYLPVPDGGVVVSTAPIDFPILPPLSSAFINNRILAKFMRHEFIGGRLPHAGIEEAYLQLFDWAEKEIDSEVPWCDMSLFTRNMLSQIDIAQSAKSRRANFAFLLQAFKEDDQLRSIGAPLFSSLPPSVSPLAFPLAILDANRDHVRRKLRECSIYCPIHWNLPLQIKEREFPAAHALSSRMLSLPIDQRYGESEMQYILERLLAIKLSA